MRAVPGQALHIPRPGFSLQQDALALRAAYPLPTPSLPPYHCLTRTFPLPPPCAEPPGSAFKVQRRACCPTRIEGVSPASRTLASPLPSPAIAAFHHQYAEEGIDISARTELLREKVYCHFPFIARQKTGDDTKECEILTAY